ncbi:MAG TPA: hypothetical protein ENN73_05945 [Firmicutes bacterium]|mgnify:CR=1 FL=1|nr:hypothetical protein [Bacillota bacterium]
MNYNTGICKPNPDLYTPIMMKIVEIKDLTEDVRFFKVKSLEGDYDAPYQPGQFMMVSLNDGAGEAPFSITSTPSRPGSIEFGIRKVGKLTEKLFTYKVGDSFGMRGPFGNGFPVEKMRGKDILIVSGGLGSVPLRSLLLYILDNRNDFGKFTYLYGAKGIGEMVYKEDFLEMLSSDKLKLHLTVDKDNSGYEGKIEEGLVTNLFRYVTDINPENTMAAVCGPPVMYKFVVKELLKLNLPKSNILLSLERRMKCGVGKCGHCIIDYIYTCVNGPVFTYWDVIHTRELI